MRVSEECDDSVGRILRDCRSVQEYRGNLAFCQKKFRGKEIDHCIFNNRLFFPLFFLLFAFLKILGG